MPHCGCRRSIRSTAGGVSNVACCTCSVNASCHIPTASSRLRLGMQQLNQLVKIQPAMVRLDVRLAVPSLHIVVRPYWLTENGPRGQQPYRRFHPRHSNVLQVLRELCTIVVHNILEGERDGSCRKKWQGHRLSTDE